MPRCPQPLPPSLGDGFAVRAALEAGVTPRRLRHSDLDAPFRGVRLIPSASVITEPAALEALELRSDHRRRAHAYAKIAPSHSFLSHVTAAVLWDLPLPIRVLRRPRGAEPSRREIDVAVFPPHRASKARGVRGRQLSPALTRVCVREGLNVSTAATTWAQLARELTVDELIEVGDAIVRIPRRRGMLRGAASDALGSLDDLTAAVAAGPRVGVAKLREALPDIRVGSASPPETDLRLALQRAGLPDPQLDFDVFSRDGRSIGFTELAYPEFRVLIEYEGDHHRTDPDQWHRDIEKHAACVAAGWDVVRLTARHLYPSPKAAIGRVRAALIRGGWRP